MELRKANTAGCAVRRPYSKRAATTPLPPPPRLAEGAGFAKEQLAAVAKTTGALAGDTAALASKAEAALGMLRQHAELEEVRSRKPWQKKP